MRPSLSISCLENPQTEEPGGLDAYRVAESDVTEDLACMHVHIAHRVCSSQLGETAEMPEVRGLQQGSAATLSLHHDDPGINEHLFSCSLL